MKRIAPVLILVLVIIAAAVFYAANRNSKNSNSSNSSSSSSQMTNMPDKTQSNATTTPQTPDKVTIKDFAFTPAAITVKKGTMVTWTNQDTAAHTVTETDGQTGPKSGSLTQGQSYSFTFAAAGTYTYYCSIHPSMKGTITVTE